IFGHLRKAKLEAGGEQPTGHDSAALGDQFSLCPVEKCGDFEHPASCRQSERYAAFSTNDPHHLAMPTLPVHIRTINFFRRSWSASHCLCSSRILFQKDDVWFGLSSFEVRSTHDLGLRNLLLRDH